MRPMNGFSKLSKKEKINHLLSSQFGPMIEQQKSLLESFWHMDADKQKVFDEFSENTLSNFYTPFGVVPNLLLNGKLLHVPMVIEESSVVAAASKACKFWLGRGGFKSEVVSMEKNGQVHFSYEGSYERIAPVFKVYKTRMMEAVTPLTQNMEKRGGGLLNIELIDKSDLEDNYFQINATFNTCDAMGANFINSVLESIAKEWESIITTTDLLADEERNIQIIMSILSNYTPNCLVKVKLECAVDDLEDPSHGMSAMSFARKIEKAVTIAKVDVHRATTHNKGIFNGIDAVILATGNDFRAIEACGHAYAARNGSYSSLSDCKVNDGHFEFSLEVPLSLGTVGGLTALHPLADFSLSLLGKPSAEELMKIVASIGLAQNFAAVRSLVTSGIQKGHMKMHLMNILNHLEATDLEREKIKQAFEEKAISFNSVREELSKYRNYQ